MRFLSMLKTRDAAGAAVGLITAILSVTALGASPSAPIQNPYKPAGQAAQQPAPQDKTPAAPDAELQAAKKISETADAPGMLQGAADFVKKYPKSNLMKAVGLRVANKIGESKEPSQRIAYGENYVAIFKDTAAADLVTTLLIDSYVKAAKPDEAFKVAGPYLEKNPEDLTVLTQVAIFGVEQIKAKKNQFAQQSEKYGLKAIGIIEAGNKPETFSDETWQEFKTKWLPQLYQQMGIVSYVSGRMDEAKTRLEKSAGLAPSDPFNYLLLGSMANADYQQLATKYKAMTSGPMQEQTLKQAMEKMDAVIDLWAHAAALSEGKLAYQPLHDSVLPDLEQYYKYRHKSTDGLQQLIDKYKK
jgi:hypothetical protein